MVLVHQCLSAFFTVPFSAISEPANQLSSSSSGVYTSGFDSGFKTSGVDSFDPVPEFNREGKVKETNNEEGLRELKARLESYTSVSTDENKQNEIGFGNKRSVDDEHNSNGEDEDDRRSFKRLVITKAKAHDFMKDANREAKG